MSTEAPAAPATEAPAAPATESAPPTTPAPSPAGLLTPDAAPPSAPANESPAPPSQFFGDHIAKEGKFQEGWSQKLEEAGFPRLARKAATATDEATLFRMLDETIGYTGKKAIPTYPGPEADDADLAAYRQSAGVPDTAEAYQLKPEDIPDGVQWSDEVAGKVAAVLHKHHVPQAAAQELIQTHLESIAGDAAKANQEYQQNITSLVKNAEATFQQEWAGEYNDRLQANRDFVASRFNPEELTNPNLAAAMAHPEIIRMIDSARRALREAPLPGVQAQATGSMSPRQQANEIMRANPKWDKDPAIAQRVQDLYKLDAAQNRH